MQVDHSDQFSLTSLQEVDLIVLGSGAAGLTAALTGAMEGMSVAVLECAPRFGGTTARSSGTAWIPNNQFMVAAGIHDDREKAEAYLSALIPDVTARSRWMEFLELAPQMQQELSGRANVGFRPYPKAPDYQSNLEGAGLGYRPLEPQEFDGKTLGEWFDKISSPMKELTVFGGMMVTRAEAQRLINVEKSLSSMKLGLKLVTRFLADRLRYKRGTRLVMGNALIARLLHEALQRGVNAYTNVEVSNLLRADGRIQGVSGKIHGRSFNITAKAGVILAGGGFPSDAALKAENLPRSGQVHTPASPYAKGTTITLGLEQGAQLGPSIGSNAMWFPSSLWTRSDGSLAVYPHIALDRAKPGSIIIDQNGNRFASEALSYHDFCEAMFQHGDSSTPAWMIVGRDFIRRYGLGVIRPRTPSLRSYITSGYLKCGRTIKDLALEIGVSQETLSASVSRYNGFAQAGKDDEFHRGETAYQRTNGDNSRGLKNPCLAPVESRNLYAIALWPTPLATARGLVCGADAQVLDADGNPMAGLYAAGNDMQSIFAGQYPGAGAQIGPAMTFGWAAARHAAKQLKQLHGREK
jgi:3-oxosteroid 1-dehydrogenase